MSDLNKQVAEGIEGRIKTIEELEGQIRNIQRRIDRFDRLWDQDDVSRAYEVLLNLKKYIKCCLKGAK